MPVGPESPTEGGGGAGRLWYQKEGGSSQGTNPSGTCRIGLEIWPRESKANTLLLSAFRPILWPQGLPSLGLLTPGPPSPFISACLGPAHVLPTSCLASGQPPESPKGSGIIGFRAEGLAWWWRASGGAVDRPCFGQQGAWGEQDAAAGSRGVELELGSQGYLRRSGP